MVAVMGRITLNRTIKPVYWLCFHSTILPLATALLPIPRFSAAISAAGPCRASCGRPLLPAALPHVAQRGVGCAALVDRQRRRAGMPTQGFALSWPCH
jgi:hypothetical protein